MSKDEVFYIEEGTKYLNKLGIENTFHDWYREIVIPQEKLIDYRFWHIRESKAFDCSLIPVKNVVGTDNSNYYGLSWIAFLGSFKNIYFKDVDAFMKECKKGGIQFSKYGNKYFINGGNHRVTIAKFLNIQELKSIVTEYFFDHDFYNLYNEYVTLNLQVKIITYPIDVEVYSRDTKWLIVINNKKVYLSNFYIAKDFIKFYKKIKVNYLLILRFKLNSFFEKTISTYHLLEEKDFIHIRAEILLHKQINPLNNPFKIIKPSKSKD